jgi:hypothetical protein
LIGAFAIFIQWAHYVERGGWWYHNMSRYVRFGGWMYLLPLLIPFGLGVLIVGLGPFRLRIDQHGVTANNWLESVRMALPWECVAAISIRRKPGDREDAQPYLMLWPVPGANVDAKESHVLEGRPAYALVQVDDIRESVDQLSAALRQYAGPRFLQTQGPPQQPPPQHPGPPQQPPQYPGSQFPPPQYPGPQYPGPQYPGPQYPGPQYPGPQFPPPGQR